MFQSCQPTHATVPERQNFSNFKPLDQIQLMLNTSYPYDPRIGLLNFTYNTKRKKIKINESNKLTLIKIVSRKGEEIFQVMNNTGKKSYWINR